MHYKKRNSLRKSDIILEKKKYFSQTQKTRHSGPIKKSSSSFRMQPGIEPALKNVFAKIGKPAQASFVPDAFQLEALKAINRTDCLVTAPTGAGKTWIAEQAIREVFNRGGRCW